MSYYNGNYNDQNQNQYDQYDHNGYNNGGMNEYTYTPVPKKNKGRRALTAVVALLSAVAIASTSIVGYSLLTGRHLSTAETTSDDSQNVKTRADGAADSQSSVDRSNLPTIIQLATPSDAMTIPDIVEKVSPSVVGISCMTYQGTATGTGIIMSEDGYIITNAHVVEDAATVSGRKAISVVLPSSYYTDESDGEMIEAELVGKDTQTDLAVLKIDKTGLVAAELGTSSEIRVGEVSIVIGNPLGFDLANSVTAGIVSATDRSITIEDRTMNMIQTDASINNGNSGGPLINAYGQVIGITSAKIASTYGEGLGFAIPIDEAVPIIQDLINYGYVTGRPTLGISGQNITEIYSQYYDIPMGFFVREVGEGSAAQQADIRVNDIVIGIEGTLIESIEEFNEIKESYKAGDTITISVYRDGEIIDKEVTLGEIVETDEDEEDSQQNYGYYGNGYGGYGNGYDDYYGFFNQFGGSY